MHKSHTVNNLTELVAYLRANTTDMTTESSFDLLQQLVGDHVRVRCEEMGKDLSKNTCREATEGKFAHLNNIKVGRVLLTSDRLRADFSRELTRQCNGVVLEYPTWRLLSVPAGMFNPKYRLADVVSNIKDYDVYDIKDGTTVTLYWHNEKWCLSSTNGFDVSDYQWMGPSTYYVAFTSLMKNYPDFSFDKLEKNKSYTIGFRHKEFHPLLTDPQKMWFIQSCDIKHASAGDTISISTTENIGLPLQTLSALPNDCARTQWFNDKNNHSLNKYVSSVRNGSSPDIHYGFVFRSKTGKPDIIVESTLLTSVRSLMYNLPKKQHQHAELITADNRLEYTILRSYLSNYTKYTFLNLFPQFEDKYRKYDDLFSKLSNRIVNILRSRDSRNFTRTNFAARKAGTLAQRIDNLAMSLADHIRIHSQINVMDSQGPNIVLDFLMNKQHLDLYYTYLINVD